MVLILIRLSCFINIKQENLINYFFYCGLKLYCLFFAFFFNYLKIHHAPMIGYVREGKFKEYVYLYMHLFGEKTLYITIN